MIDPDNYDADQGASDWEYRDKHPGRSFLITLLLCALLFGAEWLLIR